jgi:hypothetical protein
MSGSAASALTVDEADDAAAAGVVRLAGFARAVGVVTAGPGADPTAASSAAACSASAMASGDRRGPSLEDSGDSGGMPVGRPPAPS